MTDFTLFEMSDRRREQLLHRHEFYVAQARKRLFSQFDEHDIKAEADSVAREWLETHPGLCNSENSGETILEAAGDMRNGHYQLLNKMRAATIKMAVVSFFHDWEKSLRQWLVEQINHWHYGDEACSAIWKKPLIDLYDLLECFGWSLKSASYFSDLNACRLVVNVCKHGNGPSLTELAENYPQYIDKSMEDFFGKEFESWFRPTHENLRISDEDLGRFSNAILGFWCDVPSDVHASQVTKLPDWLEQAIKTDNEKKALAK